MNEWSGLNIPVCVRTPNSYWRHMSCSMSSLMKRKIGRKELLQTHTNARMHTPIKLRANDIVHNAPMQNGKINRVLAFCVRTERISLSAENKAGKYLMQFLFFFILNIAMLRVNESFNTLDVFVYA